MLSTAVRTRQRPRDLRKALLASARRLYFAHGADGVSARKIADAVGVTATSLYLHFKGVNDVLDHLRIEGHERLAEYLRGAGPELGTPARIRAMGKAYYRFGLENPRYFDLMFAPKPRGPRRREAVQREMFTLLFLRDAVQAGIATGALRRDLDADVATNALWAEIHGITALAVAGLLVETAAGHTDEVLEAVLDAAERWMLPEPYAEHR